MVNYSTYICRQFLLPKKSQLLFCIIILCRNLSKTISFSPFLIYFLRFTYSESIVFETLFYFNANQKSNWIQVQEKSKLDCQNIFFKISCDMLENESDKTFQNCP